MFNSMRTGPINNDEFSGTEGFGPLPDSLAWTGLDFTSRSSTKPRKPRIMGIWSDHIAPIASRKLSATSDSLSFRADTNSMTDITREEFNAKLETIEAKMDARVESVSAKIDGFLSAQAERDKRLDAALAQIGKDNGDTKTSIGSMKNTLIVTAVSTVLAVVLGVAGFNTALTSNMLGAFQLGKNSQAPASEIAIPEAHKTSPAVAMPSSDKSGS